MSEIVGIGANVYDTLIQTDGFPAEDTKLRAVKSQVSGGGPCATGLVAAAKLGCDCAWIGNLAADQGGEFLRADMERFGVSARWACTLVGYASFASWVLLNRETATRTCVFDKGTLPPLALSPEQEKAVEDAELLMVDGNELDAAVCGAKKAKRVLCDAGGLYPGVERLLALTDLLIPSEEFATAHTGASAAEDAAAELARRYRPEIVVVTQGKRGGFLFQDGEIRRYPAFRVDAVDSNGAGDVFHGAFAFSVIRGLSYVDCCIFSSAVSALKCTRVGARDGAPALDEVLSFLEERGYDGFEKKLGR